MKEVKNKSFNIKQKLSLLTQHALLILAGTLGFALIYGATGKWEQADAANFSSNIQDNPGEKTSTMQAVLEWMGENSVMPEQVLEQVYKAASGTDNRDLILAICLVESNFNPHAESDKGAIGLMGIMPGVWLDELKAHGIISQKEDLYKISGNIAAGAYVLTTYLSETKDLSQALRRYVGGASWYAERVLQAQRRIELASRPGQRLALAAIRH